MPSTVSIFDTRQKKLAPDTINAIETMLYAKTLTGIIEDKSIKNPLLTPLNSQSFSDDRLTLPDSASLHNQHSSSTLSLHSKLPQDLC